MSFLEYDTDIKRIFGQADLKFPYSKSDIIISPNQISEYNHFNSLIFKLNKNLEYLEDSCKFYDPSPISFDGILGNRALSVSSVSYGWTTDYSLSGYIYDSDLDIKSDPLSFRSPKDIAIEPLSGNYAYVINENVFEIILLETGDKIFTRQYKTLGDNFENLASICCLSDGKIVLLDNQKKSVITYTHDINENQLIFEYEWSGAKNNILATINPRLFNPIDMSVDSEDNLYILEKDEVVVKKFTSFGSIIQIFDFSSNLENGEFPISCCSDSKGNIHLLLSSSYVLRYNIQTDEIDRLSLTKFPDPIKIRKSADDEFLYIVFENVIIKITEDDYILAGRFGENLDGNIGFLSIFHDSQRNLYVTAYGAIIKYSDYLILRTLNQNLSSDYWPLSSLYINKDEYDQDWVYIRSFSRFYDNLELFRRSLLGKPVFVSTEIEGVSAISLQTFLPCEYREFTISRNDMLIGFNEIYSADVFNRVINNTLICMDYLMTLVEGTVEC